MDNIFGLSMTVIMIVVVAIMALCLLTVGLVALRNPVIFKMAVRNVPRRKAQTILIMVGLMLSTLIIAASLTTGDTIDYSITRSSYDGLGQTDETIAFVGETDNEGEISVNNVPIPVSIVDNLEQQLGNDPDIQGFMPLLTIDVPAVNMNARLSEFSVTMTGLDLSRLDKFGGLKDTGGSSIEDIPPGSAVISRSLADNIEAKVGQDIIFFYNNQPTTLKVIAIAKDSILTGLNVSGTADQNGIAVPIGWLQDLTGLPGQARFIAVSNTGGVESGLKLSDQVTDKLKAALANVPEGDKLGVNPVKHDAVKGAELFGNIFMSFFIVLGLFSVAAGILLIFLIFMMLAAERRSEMGMARAVGMKRRHLIQQFLSEGVAYDLGAALIGAALGVLVAFAIAGVMGALLGDFIDITPHATWRSLVVAYALGVTVTFITIIFASVRSSRLNIVQAIRDLPEFRARQHSDRPRWFWWGVPSVNPIIAYPLAVLWNVILIPLKVTVWILRTVLHYIGWGPFIALAGIWLYMQGADSGTQFTFTLGFSLIGLGVALFLRRYLPDRPVFTAIATIELIFWLLPEDIARKIFPETSGDIEMFFLSGIMMVTFATLIIMWNAEVLVAGISLLGRVISRWLPAVKTAVAYPLAAKGRTGMTIAMFSLVIFSLVTLTTINTNFSALFSTEEASAGWDINVQTSPSNPVDDLRGDLAGSDVDLNNIAGVGRISSIAYANTQIRLPGTTEWKRYQINGMDDAYMQNAEIPLEAHTANYASDADVWAALRSDPSLAVIDSFSLSSGGFGSDPDGFNLRDFKVTDGVIPPIPVELSNARTGQTVTVTIVGVIESKVSTLFGLYIPGAEFKSLYGTPDIESLYVKLAHGDTGTAETVAKQIESALLERGVQAESIQHQIDEGLKIQNGFLNLLQGFMGLGLLVGIAALGVISFRSVVERRQQIGMLRAIGYQRSMVATSFLLESLVIATLGVLSGTILAVILSYNLIHSDSFSEGTDFAGFVVPWTTITLFVVSSLLAAALMTWIPARKAASVPIAEALRYE